MCEKPMAINSAEAKKMWMLQNVPGKSLRLVIRNRQRADARLLKKEADQGRFGNIYYARAHAIRRRAVPTWGVFLNEYEQGGRSVD